MAITTDSQVADYLGLSTTPTLLTALLPYGEAEVKKFLRYDPEQKEHTEIYPAAQRSADRDVLVDVRGDKAIFTGGHQANNFLYVRNLPVRDSTATSVSSDPLVYEDYDARFGQASGAFAASTEIDRGDEWYLDYEYAGLSKSGKFVRIGANWPTQAGTVKIVYTAGYSSDELAGTDSDVDVSDIKLATLIAVGHLYKQAVLNGSTGAAGLTAGPIVSESITDYSYSVAQGAAERMGYSRGGLPSQVQRMLTPYRSYREALTR